MTGRMQTLILAAVLVVVAWDAWESHTVIRQPIREKQEEMKHKEKVRELLRSPQTSEERFSEEQLRQARSLGVSAEELRNRGAYVTVEEYLDAKQLGVSVEELRKRER